MQLVKVEFKSTHHENVAISVASIFGVVATVFGVLAVAASGGDFLLFTIPEKYEFIGLMFLVLGVFSTQEAKNQKRHSILKALILESHVDNGS